jgi:hypothetical protein
MIQRLLAILILLTACTLPAVASEKNDIVHFGTDIVVPAGESAGDIVCFFCSVDAKGAVNGDIVVFGGSLHLDEHSGGDVVVFAGDLYLGSNATIAHDLVLFGGNLHGEEGSGIRGERVIFPPVIFLPIFLALAAILWGIWMFFRWLFFGRRQYYPTPYPPVRR